MLGSEIIICGKRHDIDHPVVTFEDEGGYSAYVPHRTDDITKIYASNPSPGLARRATRYRHRRLIGSSESIEQLRRVVRQVVVHLDGCRDARMCFHVLHNDRGLSVHFMVDNDGTIYQTLDPLHCAFHAGGVNEISVGIELQNRGDAARYPNYYPEGRGTVTCRVHGHQFLCYEFTDAQYRAMVRLGGALSRLLEVPLTSPHVAGQPLWTLLDDCRHYVGFLGHFHVSATKWDPGPWDFARMFRGIGSRVVFPLSRPRPPDDDDPETMAATLARQTARYHDNSEQDVDVFFPVGPLGRSRLWHGGVHLSAPPAHPVRATLDGHLVAARAAAPCGVGSCSFVLLRHRLTVSNRPWTVFSLAFHVEIELGDAVDDATGDGAPWPSRVVGEQRAGLERGATALLDLPLEAGEVLGGVGEAGPPGNRASQIHFALFSANERTREVDPGAWEIIDGGSGRLCDVPALLRRIDRPIGRQRPDGALSRRELRNFFRFNASRDDLHRLAVRHRSEWTDGDWAAALERAPDFARLPASRRQLLIQHQIRPTLWWTERVARHCGLPVDGVVYSYHPIGFLAWYAQLSRRNARVRAAGIDSADRWEGKMAPRTLTVDAESGDEMTDVEDFFSGEHGKELTLEDLVDGYPE